MDRTLFKEISLTTVGYPLGFSANYLSVLFVDCRLPDRRCRLLSVILAVLINYLSITYQLLARVLWLKDRLACLSFYPFDFSIDI